MQSRQCLPGRAEAPDMRSHTRGDRDRAVAACVRDLRTLDDGTLRSMTGLTEASSRTTSHDSAPFLFSHVAAFVSRVPLRLAAGLLVTLPGVLIAQRTTARPVTAAAPSDTGGRRTLSTAMYGDAAVVINRRADGRVEIAAAGATHRVTVAIAPRALLAWADSTATMISRRVAPLKKSETTRTIRSFLDEPGLASGGLSLTRRVHPSGSSYSVFFADSVFGGFSIPLSRQDAGVFVSAARRAALSVRDANAGNKPRPRATKPRAKRPAATRP